MGEMRDINNIAIYDAYRDRNIYFEEKGYSYLLYLNVNEAVFKCYDYYWIHTSILEEDTVNRMKYDLRYYLLNYGKYIKLKKKIMITIFLISPSATKVIKWFRMKIEAYCMNINMRK